MVREQVFAHWGYWHLSPKGLKSLFKVLWELHHSVGNKCMVVHVTVMDSSQLSTSWSPCPERALTSSIVIGWVAAAMMSSILNRDFISMRLIVQGMSLKKSEKKKNYKNGYKLYWTCWQWLMQAWQVNAGDGVDMIDMSPLVEQNKHGDTAQRLSREYWQQLDTGRRYLSNVDWVHHELCKHTHKKSKKNL